MIIQILLTLIFNFLLFSCGGSIIINKQNNPEIIFTDNTPPETKQDTPKTLPSPQTPTPQPPTSIPTIATEELKFVSLINDYRTQAGLSTLKISETLNGSSKWMSNDLAFTYAQRNSLSHTDSLSRDPFKRMSDLGYDYSTTKAENLFAGSQNAQAVFDAWKNSPGHNQNMLNANVKVIGISRVYNADSIYKYYWTANFGGFDDSK